MNLIICRYGDFYIPNINDLVSRSLFKYGEWGQDEIDSIGQFIQEGDIVVDAGAYIGTHTRAFSKMVGENGTVIAFEPNPDSFNVLMENAKLSVNKNIDLFPFALGDSDSKNAQSVVSNQDNKGANVVVISPSDTTGTPIHVRRLDSFNFSKIDFIKADLEGMEYSMLVGANETISRCRPVIFLELNCLADGFQLFKWAGEKDYLVYGLLSSPYNSNNFNKDREDIFGLAKEVGVILIPSSQTRKFEFLPSLKSMVRIYSPDDLVMLILHKPQYFGEVLENTSVAKIFGLGISSPLSRKLTEDVLRLQSENEIFVGKLSDLNSEKLILETELEQQRSLNNALLDSTSWKVTGPLRKLASFFHKISRLLPLIRGYRVRHPGLRGIRRLVSNIVCSKSISELKTKIREMEIVCQNTIAVTAESFQAEPISMLYDEIGNNIDAKSVLIFDHNGGGGSNTYTNELVKSELEAGRLVSRVYFFRTNWFVQVISSKAQKLYLTPEIDQLFDVLKKLSAAQIIINSLYGYPNIEIAISKIINISEANNSEIDFKVHDFFALCPSPHLSDSDKKYCGVPDDLSVCAECLKKNLAWYHEWYPVENRPTNILDWRAPFNDLFRASNKITFFDKSGLEIIKKGISVDDLKVNILPHSVSYLKLDRKLNYGRDLHIGVMGTISHVKGSRVVRELAKYIKTHCNSVKTTIVGSWHDSGSVDANVVGAYSVQDLPDIIENRGINVILVPSVVPETFSYVISEAMIMGLPIVSFDIGAQGSRVKQYPLGRVIPLNSSPNIILEALQSALNEAQR